MKRTAGAVLSLLLAAMALLSCGDGILSPKGHWNPIDEQYDPTTDPENTADEKPFAPMSLTATAASDTAIDLAWRDASAHETGYRVYRKTGSAGSYAALSPDLPPDAVSYRSTDLSASTVYWFKVTAFNAVGESDPSNEASATTQATPAAATKEITAFSFSSPAATGVVVESAKTISVTVPFGTDVTALVAVFTTTGAGVEVGGVPQVSGTTQNDFTNPVEYVVTAQDSSTAAYTVTVTAAAAPLSSAKEITAFSFSSPAATGVIDEGAKTISVTVPFGTDVTALVAVFTTTGAGVKVGGVTQVSGTTPNNFTGPVEYEVAAQDGTSVTWIVTVTAAGASEKEITAFSFSSPAATGVIDESAKTISVTVPYGTDVTALVAVFTTTGTGVKVGGVTQVSGTTQNDFTGPVEYLVTAQDAGSVTYTVTVTAAGPTSWKLFQLEGGSWAADPDPPSGTISVTGWSSTLYALTEGGSVHRWDGGWQEEAVTAPTGAVSLAGCAGTLYAFTDANQIFVLDGGWRALGIAPPASSTAIAGAGDVLYALSDGPALSRLDGAWAAMAVPAGTVSIAGLDGVPYSMTGAGIISLYDGGWKAQGVAAPSGSRMIAGCMGTLHVLVLQ